MASGWIASSPISARFGGAVCHGMRKQGGAFIWIPAGGSRLCYKNHLVLPGTGSGGHAVTWCHKPAGVAFLTVS